MVAVRDMQRMLRPMWLRVRLMVARGVLALVQDAHRMQEIQVRLHKGEVTDRVEHWQPYGLTYHPLPGAEVLMVFPRGDRSHGVALAVADRRYRLQALEAGEVAIYDDQGQKIVLYRDRVEVEAPKVVVLSDDVHLGSEGGPRVARIGDRVQVSSGSSAGLWPIVEGSTRVSST